MMDSYLIRQAARARNVPGALAAASATGKLLALLTDGTAELAAPGSHQGASL